MSIVQRILDAVAPPGEYRSALLRPAPVAPAAQSAERIFIPAGGAGVPQRNVYAPVNYGGYPRTVAAVYKCVTKRGKNLSRPALKLYRRNGLGERREVAAEEHPAARLVANPNPAHSWCDLDRLRWLGLDLWGFSPLYVERNMLGIPVEVHWLRPDRTVFVPGGPDLIQGIEYRAENGRAIDIPFADVVPFRYMDPLDPVYGWLSPLSSARVSADSSLYGKQYNRTLMQNGGQMSNVYIKTDQMLSIDDAKKYGDRWAERNQGPERAGRPPVFGQGAEPKTLGLPPADMEYLGLMAMSEKDVAGVYDVPPPLIGILDDADYANVNTLTRSWWWNGLVPELTWSEKIWNEYLLPMFPSQRGLFYAYDVADVAELRESQESQENRAHKAIQSGARTINEVRREFNWGMDLAWGDVAWLPANLRPVKDDSPPPMAPPSQQPAAGGGEGGRPEGDNPRDDGRRQ